MTETMGTYAAMLKEWYTTKRVENMTFRNAPLLAMIPKNTEIEGETWDIPLIVADPQAGSSDFLTGQGNKGASTTRKFQMTTVNEYSFAAISRKVIKASKSNKGSFLPAARVQVDGAFNTCKRSLAISSYRDGSGAKGQVGAIATTDVADDTITLLDPDDVVNFHVGETLDYATTKTGGAVEAKVGTNDFIVKIDKANGNLVFGGSVLTEFSDPIAINDYLYRAGDYDGVVTGLQSWLSGDGSTIFGVDRSIDSVALSGVTYNGSSQLTYEALIDGQSNVATLGDGVPDHAFVHPSQTRALVKEQAGKVEWTTFQVTAEIGFQGFIIQGDAGQMRVIPDRYCPATSAFLLQLDTWELGSMGPVPDIFDRDSDQEMLREGLSDGYEVRIGGYPQIACHAPGYNGNVTLAAQS